MKLINLSERELQDLRIITAQGWEESGVMRDVQYNKNIGSFVKKLAQKMSRSIRQSYKDLGFKIYDADFASNFVNDIVQISYEAMLVRPQNLNEEILSLSFSMIYSLSETDENPDEQELEELSKLLMQTVLLYQEEGYLKDFNLELFLEGLAGIIASEEESDLAKNVNPNFFTDDMSRAYSAIVNSRLLELDDFQTALLYRTDSIYLLKDTSDIFSIPNFEALVSHYVAAFPAHADLIFFQELTESLDILEKLEEKGILPFELPQDYVSQIIKALNDSNNESVEKRSKFLLSKTGTLTYHGRSNIYIGSIFEKGILDKYRAKRNKNADYKEITSKRYQQVVEEFIEDLEYLELASEVLSWMKTTCSTFMEELYDYYRRPISQLSASAFTTIFLQRYFYDAKRPILEMIVSFGVILEFLAWMSEGERYKKADTAYDKLKEVENLIINRRLAYAVASVNPKSELIDMSKMSLDEFFDRK